MSSSDAMGAEFDTVAEWTAQVAADFDPSVHIPAACRGSGSPGVLRWFLDRLDVSPGTIFLDCGAGVGGPAAYAARETGVVPLLTDPEEGACRAARSLFGYLALRAAGPLPIATESIRAGWSLGVLCTAADQPGFLAEIRRILQPEGRFGLLVYVATGSLRHPAPEGNSFPTRDALDRMLADASLAVQDSGVSDDFATISSTWQESVRVVEAALQRRHGHDPRWQSAEEQSRRIGRLLSTGEVIGVLQVVQPA